MYFDHQKLALSKLEESIEYGKLKGISLDHLINVFSYDEDKICYVYGLLKDHNLIEQDSIVYATFHILNHYINSTPLEDKFLLIVLRRSQHGGLRMPLRFLSRLERYEDANDLLDRFNALEKGTNVSSNRTVASFHNAEKYYLNSLIQNKSHYIKLFDFNPAHNRRLRSEYTEYLDDFDTPLDTFCPLKFCLLDDENKQHLFSFDEELTAVLPDVGLYYGTDICISDKKTIFQLNTGYTPGQIFSPGNPLLWMKKWHFNKPKKVIDNVIFYTNNGLNENYYHDLLDNLPAIYASIASTLSGDILLPFTREELIGYLDYPIFVLEKFAQKHDRQIIFLDEPVLIKKATFLHIGRSAKFAAHLFESMFASPSDTDAVTQQNLNDKIYISRKKSKNRPLSNEEEIENLFSKFGFKIIVAEDYSFQQQYQLFRNAKIVAGPHGAGLTNILFGNASMMIELFNESYMPDCYEEIAQEMLIEYISLTGQSVSQGEKNSWMISVSKVEKLLQTLSLK